MPNVSSHCATATPGKTCFGNCSQNPSDDIEIIIEGKRYKSIREYKRQKIKNNLKEIFSSSSSQEFSKEELFEIIQEVLNPLKNGATPLEDSEPQDQPAAAPPKDPSSVKDDAQNLSMDQLQEMLDEYKKEHQGAGNLIIDPNKVKNIIIEPKTESQDTLLD